MTGEPVTALSLLPPPRPCLCAGAQTMLAGTKVKAGTVPRPSLSVAKPTVPSFSPTFKNQTVQSKAQDLPT